MLTVENLQVRSYSGLAVGPLNIKLKESEWLTVTGSVGSGKTSTLLALGGLSNSDIKAGCVYWDDTPIYDKRRSGHSQITSFICSRPDLTFSGIASTVRDEIALFCNCSSNNRAHDLAALISSLGVEFLLDRDISSLSGGERTRVAFAIALAQYPSILLVDQAAEWLDKPSRNMILSLLLEEKRKGLIIIESATRRRLNEHPDVLIDLDAFASLLPKRKSLPDIIPQMVKTLVSVDVRNITASYETGSFRLGPITANFSSGERIALIGENGAGKTTLLRALGLLLPMRSGTLELIFQHEGKAVSLSSSDFADKQHLWAQYLLYCFQEPDDQLFCATVQDELLFTTEKTGILAPFPTDWISELFSLGDKMHASPLALPRGLRRIVLIASLIKARPKVLLLDEPTAELDETQVQALLHVLNVYTKLGGICIAVSHDSDFVNLFATRTLHVTDGLIQ